MQKFSILVIILFLFSFSNVCVSAQQHPDQIWVSANQLCEQGDYSAAISAYQSIPAFEKKPKVLYNLGNAYFQSGQLGRAILNFERAFRLAPSNKSIQHNLAIAKAKIQNPYSDTSFFMKRWWIQIFSFFSPNVWAVILWLLAFLLAFAFAWRKKKSFAKWTLPLFTVLFMLVATVLYLGLSKIQSKDDAIVLQGLQQYYSDSNLSKTIDRVIPEGTQVKILESKEGVVRFQLPNGVIGYLSPAVVEKI